MIYLRALIPKAEIRIYTNLDINVYQRIGNINKQQQKEKTEYKNGRMYSTL